MAGSTNWSFPRIECARRTGIVDRRIEASDDLGDIIDNDNVDNVEIDITISAVS